eukprot:TRINITY_DN5022_c0_g2_i2.p1 TRINITY_DN5022_c0_g2~~TRINITY_DN5022_c0_g2_i2.p1  ORF type:complete len:543 (+),score=174.46 TRINITY_DN5022_c0_g2_i2:251-1879(+)
MVTFVEVVRGGSLVTQYKLLSNNVCLRLRFPQYVSQMNQQYGKQGEALMEVLLERGIVSTRQLLQEAVARSTVDAAGSVASEQVEYSAAKRAFKEMCAGGYVVRAERMVHATDVPTASKQDTAAELALLGGSSEAPAASTSPEPEKRKSKGKGKDKDKDKEHKKRKHKHDGKEKDKEKEKHPSRRRKLDEGKEVAVEPSEGLVSINTSPEMMLLSGQLGVPDAASTSVMPIPETTAPPPPQLLTETESAAFSGTVDTTHSEAAELETLWRVSFQQFLVDARKQACIALVSEKIDSTAGHIIRAMFELSRNGTESVDVNALHHALISNTTTKELSTVSLSTLQNYLEVMCKDKTQPVGRRYVPGSRDPGNLFSLNLNNMVSVLKQKMVESVIHDKFGPRSFRIFRILVLKKVLESKQICEFAMISPTETRERLYQLHSAKYIHMQEVPKSADHAPARTMYFWTVRYDETRRVVCGEVYKAISNLRARLAAELARASEAIIKYTSQCPLSELEREQIEQLQITQERIEASVIHMDDMLMRLRDF